MKGASCSEEFPLLEGVGLYASDISGDGNCLFHALSDQLYGHENNHAEIRERVVEHMRVHAEYFKLFLDVGPARRAPKRKATTGANKPIVGPTEGAIDNAFAQHLKRMSKSGVYGDNMEISAFARDYNCDVKIYQREFAYVVSGGDGVPGFRKIMHIAYHTWEHYSSIRNRDGPHTDLPNITPKPLTEEGRKEQERKLADTSYVLPWMEGVVASSLPYIADPAKIRQALEQCKGNVDEAVSWLLDAGAEGEGEGGEEILQEVTGKKHASRSPSPKVTDREVEAETGSEDKEETGKNEGSRNEVSGRKPTKKQTALQTRISARIKAKEDQKLRNTESGSGPDNPGPTGEESQKQPTPKLKREIAREKKSRRKEAAEARKREKNVSKKDEETEGVTATITSGIKELYI